MTPTGVTAKDYRTGLSAYMNSVRETGWAADTDALRLEAQFECLRDWSQVHTLEEVREWFLERRATCQMTLQDLPLADCRGWYLDDGTGWWRHESGGFFWVQGLRVGQTTTREVGERGWDQPILTQVDYDGGILGLLRRRIDGVPHYLVEAKAEPGNYERVQMSPTLQATFSNLERAHGGSKPRFAEIFERPEAHEATVHYRAWLSEDGGRLYRKRNLGMLVEVPESTGIDAPDSFRWMSLWQIKACLHENAWVNPHIRGIIAHL